MRGNIMTTAEKQSIADAYLRFGTIKRVRQETGVGHNSIFRIIKEYGLCKGTGGNQPQRKASDEEIIEAIEAGLTRQQIADKFGMHVENLARRMYRIGRYAKNSPNRYSHPRPETDTWHYTAGAARLIEERQGSDFEFVAYKRNRIRLRCKTCGSVIERADSTIREKKVRCENCLEREKLAEARSNLIATLKAVQDAKTPKTCERCGAVFFSPYPTQIYCSKTCKRKGHHGDHRRRCQKYGVLYTPGITLKALFKRDGGICQICGEPTDWKDGSWTGSFGALYPTIDHIVALANGGTHTWDNVQLAHAICNSYKRDQEVDGWT